MPYFEGTSPLMSNFRTENLYQSHPHYKRIKEILSEGNPGGVRIEGVAGSAGSLILAGLFRELSNCHLIVMPEKDDAAYLLNDLNSLLPDEDILFFPSSFKRSARYTATDPANIVMRTSVLNRLAAERGKTLVVTYPEALMEKVISRNSLKKNTLKISRGDNLPAEFIEEVMQEYGFLRTDFVYEPGQYAVRGSIIDLFSFSASRPFRLDFFGESVESIRTFNPEDQLSEDVVNEITVIPNIQESTTGGIKKSLLSFLPRGSVVWIETPDYVKEKINQIYSLTGESEDETESRESVEDYLLTGSHLIEEIKEFSLVVTGRQSLNREERVFAFEIDPQPSFNKNFNLLGDRLQSNRENGYTNYIVSESETQNERLRSIFTEISSTPLFKSIEVNLHAGFTDHHLRVALYTDHQIFDRYHRYRIKGYFTTRENIAIKELTDLNPGDYVVHIDHGIGRFGGLERIEVNGRMQEAIKLVYRDNDILYLGIHSLHRISKYKGKDAIEPRIHKLGSGAWQKLKQATSRKIKEIAADLIKLYAKRLSQPGFGYTPDSYLQHELEASFQYEDTPDQVSSTAAVKSDMEAGHPMDRLICGDVGFGKTEVAIRAAFKAATDGKQTAVLVPTTILALQHYKTFTSRLKGFPCRVEYISRHRKPAEQKRIISDLKEGNIDIIIGTHKLAGKEVGFKELGLLIIDEEQRFGVAVKEKIRELKVNVDTLTLTATPIPRTLQFSLMGARDLSIINTPPPNRVPIVTELHGFNEDIIREGIEYETGRNGQVFFLHNRIENIKAVEDTIRRICPQVKTAIVHGRMSGIETENIMSDFIEGDYDVLIATSIIESGLDIPNANTIFINDAHHFGLSELHQLRGRVGRSNIKAFCYLLTPPMVTLTHEARRRLIAIEQFSGLGSGFNIAMQDLDIRGAGNLLGGEQSGFIAEIGFETYQKILAEALAELKATGDETEVAGVPEKTAFTATAKTDDTQVDTDMEIMLPDSYISNITERIRLYQELNEINSEEELTAFVVRLTDRFGQMPRQAEALIETVKVKWIAASLGVVKLTLKNGVMILTFPGENGSVYYSSPLFASLMAHLSRNPAKIRVRQKGERLTVTIAEISSVEGAGRALRALHTGATE